MNEIEVMWNGEKLIKTALTCMDEKHKKQIDMIGDLQIYCSNRLAAPNPKIEQFKLCPYCGKKLNA